MPTATLNGRTMRRLAAAGLLAAAFAAAPPAFGQAEGPGSGDAGEQRMLELIERIKASMKEIDDNLLKAGSPPAARDSDRSTEAILNATRSKHQQVIRDIDELIRSVKYLDSPSSSQPQQQQPEAEPRSQPQPRRENPSNDELQENPSRQDENRQPKDEGGAANQRPRQEDASGRRQDPDPEEVDRADASGRWGLLPPKVQEEILNSNVEDLPQKYRKWLEEYYRRVSKRR